MINKLQPKNITIRQALIIFVLLLGSPSVRALPNYTVGMAKQAAWLCVFFSIIAIIIYLYMIQKVFIKYEKESLIQIMEDIFGRITGKTIGIVFFLYITLYTAYYIRYYSERLSASLSISTSHIVYCGILLIVLSLILKYDIVVLGRMNEILLWAVVVPYIILNILSLPKIKFSNLYPITYTDFVPAFKGGLGIISLWSFITFIFLFSDRIVNKKNTVKEGLIAVLLLSILTFFVILIPLGIFGNSTDRLYFPYAAAIQNISLFGTIERVEAFIVAIWVMTDFSLISCFVYSGLHTLKSTLKLSDYKPFLNIYLVVLYFLSIYIANRIFELQEFGFNLLVYINILLGFALPFVMFFVGKLRKKL